MKKKKGRRKFNNLKRTLKGFMEDEDGYITKNNILKLGLGTLSALSIIGSLSNAFASHANHASHTNNNNIVQAWSGPCYRFEAVHTSHPSHGSHSNY